MDAQIDLRLCCSPPSPISPIGYLWGPCFVIQYFVSSSFAIILMGMRELIFLVSCNSHCVGLFHAVLWVGQWCVIAVVPDHNHLLFYRFSIVMIIF